MSILLVDVSHWQGTIDWNVMKSRGVRGAIIKASEGTTWRDGQFKRNVDECHRLGIPFGVYHFYLPQFDTNGQVDNLLNAVTGIPVNLSLWGDFETASTTLDRYSISSRSYNFMHGISDGNRAGEYTSPGYSDSYFVTNETPPKPDMRHAEFDSWLAHYTTDSYPMLPDIGKKPLIWQFTSKGNGYFYGAQSATIDLNYWMGTEQEFAAYTGIENDIPEPTPVPDPEPTPDPEPIPVPDPTPIPGQTFADVPPTHWAYAAIEKLYKAGVVSGSVVNGQLLFSPNANVTRAQAAVMLANLKGFDPLDKAHLELLFAEWQKNHPTSVSPA